MFVVAPVFDEVGVVPLSLVPLPRVGVRLVKEKGSGGGGGGSVEEER